VLHRGRRVPFRDLIRFDELAKRFNVRIGRPTAVTPGKMSASAACLGPKARKQAGWREVATPEALVEAIELGYSPANDASPPPAPERRSRLIAWHHALGARTAL
jgi:hypothetical protein